jgi:hypothetical protein
LFLPLWAFKIAILEHNAISLQTRTKNVQTTFGHALLQLKPLTLLVLVEKCFWRLKIGPEKVLGLVGHPKIWQLKLK